MEWEHHKPIDASVGQLRHDTDLKATIQTAIDQANQAVSRAEAIKQWRVLPSQFVVGDELTATQKVRRQHVLTKLADDVNALYRTERRPVPYQQDLGP